MSQKKRTWSKSCHVVRECCLGVGSSWARPARDHPGAVAGSRRSAGHLVGVGGHFSWPVAFLTEAGFRNYRTRSVGGMRRLQDGRLHQPPDWLFRDGTRHPGHCARAGIRAVAERLRGRGAAVAVGGRPGVTLRPRLDVCQCGLPNGSSFSHSGWGSQWNCAIPNTSKVYSNRLEEFL